MTEYKYICTKHRFWVDENPKDAFESIQKMTKLAEQLLQKNQPNQAIPYLGTAYETAQIIFDNRLESPQLTTSLTSSAIMLAHAYAATNQLNAANILLKHLNTKMKCAIECAYGYTTKVAFFEHCSRAITEAKNDIMLASTIPTLKPNQYSQLH
ncbi:hypothetical protein [Paraglaciecola arctica]|uniref:hypothetical protein n=1 Tax=Paraglaciecola arctica TaxID=1128911 RepID=UPI001C06FDBB|nr:hypothetical protein [Paraglaciecola arctica]MBU3002453.1 hypothetical protein [Paraglaciecola arctica]